MTRRSYGVTPDVRFWRHVKYGKAGECWEWQAYRTPKGYGRFQVFGQSVRAHIYAFETCVGELLPGNEVCHSCDNPPCCNPGHLSQGTHAENMRQAAERRRLRSSRKGEDEPCPKGHLGPWRYSKNGGRICASCAVERKEAWRQARREAGLPVT